MKISLNIKTLLRTPLKTLVTFLLLAATSYMLFLSVAEYSAVSREMERAVDFYYGLGAVEVEPARQDIPEGFWSPTLAAEDRYPAYGTDLYLYTDKRVKDSPYEEELLQIGYTGLRQSDIDAISKLPYVTGTSVRYMTAGVSDTLMRLDDRNDFYNYTARFIVQASLGDTLVSYDPPAPDGSPGAAWLPFNYFRLLTDDQQRYGRELNFKLTIVWVRDFDPANTGGRIVPYGGGSYNPRLYKIIHTRADLYDEVYNYDFLSSLKIRERFVIVGRMDPSPNGRSQYALGDPSSIGRYPQVYALRDQPDNYLELEEFAPLRELIELTNTDIHTLDVVYTDDMSSVMRVAEGNITSANGRMLTPEDSANENKVCVMSAEYMFRNNLRVGDKITLNLGDKLFEQNAALGSVAVVAERQSENYTEVEFEIVGAYKNTDTSAQQAANLHWTYSVNTVFVPMPFLSAEIPADHELKPGEFSFKIDDPRNISKFLEEARPVIEGDLGLTLMFTDGGWSAVEKQIMQAKTLATVRLLLLAFAVILAICLTVYLFVGRKRKEYAIMRALGTPIWLSSRTLYIPLATLGIFAPAVGTVFGYYFTGSRIENVLAPLTEAGIETAPAAIPVSLVFVCFACVITALALATGFMLRRLSKKPPLELLQADAGTAAGSTRSAPLEDAAPDVSSLTATGVRKPQSASATSASGSKPVEFERQRAARHMIRYVARHIRRTPAKAMQSLGLALLLFGAIGQLTVVRGTYRDIYKNMNQKAYIMDGFNLKSSLDANHLFYVDSVYYENVIQSLKFDHDQLETVMTNDIQRFSDNTIEVNFLEGYDYSTQNTIDSSNVGTVNRTCIWQKSLMERLGVQLGDTVRIFNANDQYTMMFEIYRFPPNTEEQRIEWEDSVDQYMDARSVYYTVVGEIISGGSPYMIITPVSRGFDPIVYSIDDNTIDYAEFILASPEYAENFRTFVEKRIPGTVGDIGSPFVMDTSEADNTKQTIALIETLYPIAVAAALVMGGLFPGLIVMQSDREASIMRVLGTTKRRTRAILVTEQAALCFIGQVFAAALLLIINGILLLRHSTAIGIFGAALIFTCTAGALIFAIIITRRRILELLQVKE